MTKIKLDQRFSPYQMPATIIGTIVDEKPNFMTCTWVSRLNRSPPTWMASINVKHYTMEGIRKNRIFSINFPSADIIKETDYIGITSGRIFDKSKFFKLFYGETKAPMIKDCTINIELSVKDIIELPDVPFMKGDCMLEAWYQVSGKAFTPIYVEILYKQ